MLVRCLVPLPTYAISSSRAKAPGRTSALSTRSMNTLAFFEVHQPPNRANPTLGSDRQGMSIILNV